MPILRERMGNGCSRVKFCARKAPWRRREPEEAGEEEAPAEAPDEPLLRPQDDAEREELERLAALARDKPHVFLLDNLMLSVQLFTHYEKEIATAQEQLSAREQKLNEKLRPKKKALLVDALREHFGGRVCFSSYCRADNEEETVEPLRPIQVYLVYENVLVAEREAHYFSPGDSEPDYTFILKEAEQKGYVRLEKPQGSKDLGSINLSSIAENEDEIYSNEESIYGPINGQQTSGSVTDEEIYNEATPNGALIHDRFNRRFPKKQKPGSASSSSSGYTTNGCPDSDSDSSYLDGRYATGELHEVPFRCYKRVTYDDSGNIYEGPKVSSRQQDRWREKKQAYNRNVVYVNAYQFARHYRTVFRRHLVGLLNFDRNDIVFAGRSEPAVYLEKIDYLSTEQKRQLINEQFEVIPCFSTPCSKWAGEWMHRQRGKWPTDEEVRKIGSYNCHLVPSCTKLNHRLWKLNWRLCFPLAERHLEGCFSAAQTTVYAIALMLHKTFVSRRSLCQGLSQAHIKNMMFLKVEEHPLWKETDMGKKILDLLKSLHRDIKQRSMRDYFMPERNLFADTPEDGLLHSQKQLQRIIENPVMFVFHAMEKIEYEDRSYPRLDYRQLMRLLTQDVLALINPNLEAYSKNQEGQGEGNKIYGKAKGKFWLDAKQTGQSYVQSKMRSTVIKPEKGFDSTISIQEKCESLSRTRLSLLLAFFSDHFLEMARSCHRLGSMQGKDLYLRQVRLLALLLAEDQDYRPQAKQLMEAVGGLRARTTTPAVPEAAPPQTPRRNADLPVFVRALNDRFAPQSPTPEVQVTNSYGAAANGPGIVEAETTEF